MDRTSSSSLAIERGSGLDWVHRNVARKIFLEGVGRKRLFDIGCPDVSQCQACQVEEGKEKHRLYQCPEWHAVRRDIPESFRKWEQEARTSKKRMEVTVQSHTLSVKANGIEATSV